MNKKVLVTGANGLLGSHVVRELLKRDYQVRVLVRPGSDLRALNDLKVDFFNGQITQKEDIEKAVKGCNYIVHSAARTSPKPSALEAYKNVNIDSTQYIVEAGKKQGIKRLVFVSTANCFGNGTKANPGNEKHPFLPWLKDSGYAYSKYLAQQWVLKETKAGSVDAVVVNPTFIIGSTPGSRSSGQIFSHILNKKVAFYPPGGKNFVEAEAAATGVVNALEKGTTGECYLLAGENLSYREFFHLTAHVAGQRSILIPIPSFLLMLLGHWGDFSEKVLRWPVQLTSANARMLCLGNYFTPKKAIEELELPMVPAKKAIEKAIQ